MGKSLKHEIKNRLIVLLTHLLKQLYAPELLERNARLWWLTIREQRSRLNDRLEDSPSLRRYATAAFPKAYREAVIRAAIEADRQEVDFPSEPTFTLDDALSDAFPVQGKPAAGGGSPVA
jgi:hypothetical protein